jgi:hypothetical protein
LASCLRIIPSKSALITFFSSAVNLEMASNWSRRSPSGPRSSAPKINTSALTCRATASRQITSSVGLRRAALITPHLDHVKIDEFGQGLLSKAPFHPKGSQSFTKIHLWNSWPIRANRLMHRHEQKKYLALINSIALLHQHQRDVMRATRGDMSCRMNRIH